MQRRQRWCIPLVMMVIALRTQALVIQTESAHLYPTITSGVTQFGSAVALSADGMRALVGAELDDVVASDAGSAYLFDRSAGGSSNYTLFDIAYPTNGNGPPQFGFAVALSSDGTLALVGAPYDDIMGVFAGAVYVFSCGNGTSGNLTLEQTLYPANGTSSAFGWSVTLHSPYALVGAIFDDTMGSAAGAAHVLWANATGTFGSVQTLYPVSVAGSPLFGSSVALAGPPGLADVRALVGANQDGTEGVNAGAAYIFEQLFGSPPGNFALVDTMYPTSGAGNPFFGYSVALSGDGTRALAGAYRDDTLGPNAGVAYVFDQNEGSNFTLVDVLFPSTGIGNPEFGFSVAISANGARVLIGASGDDTAYAGAGAAYVFDQLASNDSFTLVTTLSPLATDTPFFGHSVALSSDGSQALVGAILDDIESADAGAADWVKLTTILDVPIVVESGNPLVISGDLNIGGNTTVTITVTNDGLLSGEPYIIVAGCASFGGTLVLNASTVSIADLDGGELVVATYNSLCDNYTPFTEVELEYDDGSSCSAVSTSQDYGGASFNVLLDVDTNSCTDGEESDNQDAMIGGVIGAVAAAAFVCCMLATCCLGCLGFAVAPTIGGMSFRVHRAISSPFLVIAARWHNVPVNAESTVQFDESDFQPVSDSERKEHDSSSDFLDLGVDSSCEVTLLS